MAYEASINKAWEELGKLSDANSREVFLLVDTYSINIKDKSIFSNSCNVPVKEYLAILILHYLIGSLKTKYAPCGEWISFKEIKGGEAYFSAFRKGSIEPLLRKYGRHPENLLGVLNRFKGNKIEAGDVAVELVTFPDIAIRLILWKADSEFGPEATMLFDKNISMVYSMEDIVVFSHFIINNL